MIRVKRYGDVTRFECATFTGRAAGYTASAYRVQGTLIDTGPPRTAQALAAMLAREPLAGAIVTHWHEDHAGGAAGLAARGVPLSLDGETERRLREAPPLELYRRLTWGSFTRLRGPVAGFLPPAALEVIATPGHASDHRAVWIAATRTLFSGDLFLGVKVRVAHEGEDFVALLASLRRCAALVPLRMFCAHRGLVPNAESALRAKADWLEETIAAVGRHVEDGWSEERIVRELFGGEGMIGVISRGHYSALGFVRVARRAARKLASDDDP